jgi:hypothetical protein
MRAISCRSSSTDTYPPGHSALTGIGGTGSVAVQPVLSATPRPSCAFGTLAEPPADVVDLCHQICDIPGNDPARLSSDPDTAEQTLRDLIARVRQLAETPPDDADHG